MQASQASGDKMSARRTRGGVRWLTLGGLALTLGASACAAGDPAPGAGEAPLPTSGAASAPAGEAPLTRLGGQAYDSAVRDLLGLPATETAPDPALGDAPASGVAANGLTDAFGNTDAFAVNDAAVERTFEAADALAERVFANPLLAANILTCTPSVETACTQQIVTRFGLRAWQTPLATSDVDRLTRLATDAIALGETPVNSIKQVVKTVLVSPQFLYRVELAAASTSL